MHGTCHFAHTEMHRQESVQGSVALRPQTGDFPGQTCSTLGSCTGQGDVRSSALLLSGILSHEATATGRAPT